MSQYSKLGKTVRRKRILHRWTQEISRRTSHDPHRVDKYIKDHQRVVAAHKAGHSFDEICLLTGLSPGLVQEHLELYQRLTNKEALQGVTD